MTDPIRFETAAIHVGQDPDPATGAAVVPIYQTSTYVQRAVGEHKGFEYSRTDNPTRKALEVCLAALDGATQGVAFASGMAAIATIGMTLSTGSRVLLTNDVYGGTYRLFARVFSDLGVAVETVDMTDLDAVRKVADEGVDLVIAETPTNPLLRVVDLEALAEISRSAGAMFVVDNTFATPYIQRPLELGATACVYSATKYLGGHSDLVLGAVTTNDEELATRVRFLQNAAGAVPGPFDCWLLLRGLKTLAIRMRAHSENASAVARWLSQRPEVVRVNYPGLESFPGYEVARSQMAAAGEPLYGGMVTIELDSRERALTLCRSTKLFWLAESLGGVESLIEHPGQMTHLSLAGSDIEVPDTLVRISVGLEHIDDLLADLEQALLACN